MRDLKFRAWNRIVKRFQYFVLQDIEKQKGSIQWQNLEIQQYTGLRDSKGKKIYEGDIVKFSCERFYTSKEVGLENREFISAVEYDTDCFIISETMIKIKEFMVSYGVIDIKMRMLNIPELKQIQGFPKDYKLVGNQTE